MALFTEQQLYARLNQEIVSGGVSANAKARILLSESLQKSFSEGTEEKRYDIFLSHSSNDARKVAGLKLSLEDLGYSVYVDWIEDKQLDRSHVTKATAATLRERMDRCNSLFFAFSENSSGSIWMPWELGYFDGKKQKAAILPILESSEITEEYLGVEYLGIYYYITKEVSTRGEMRLWVNETSSKYIVYEGWVDNNIEPIQR
jgi:hypothetical protein